jgi:hypothetical protein
MFTYTDAIPCLMKIILQSPEEQVQQHKHNAHRDAGIEPELNYMYCLAFFVNKTNGSLF